MAWQTPKTDWGPTDGVRDSDFNRIEGNILELYNTGSLRSDLTIYVNAGTGSDSGNGSASSPYKTIAKALSTVPSNIGDKSVLISLAAGVYNESVEIKGFEGPITITGAIGAVVTINSLRVDGCNCSLNAITLECNGAVIVTNGAHLMGEGSLRVDGYTISVNYGSVLYLLDVTCSNASGVAINVNRCARFYASALYGDNNGTGINCQSGSVVAYGTNYLTAKTAAIVTSTGGRVYTLAQQSAPIY